MGVHEIWVTGTDNLFHVREIFRANNTPLEALSAHSGRVNEDRAAVITFKSDGEAASGALEELERSGAYFMPGV